MLKRWFLAILPWVLLPAMVFAAARPVIEVSPAEAAALLGTKPGVFLLDVRTADEVAESGKLDDAVNIPLAELRDRLGELPVDRAIVAYCQKGQRGYFATCLLRERGFEKAANLRGGYLQARLNGL